MVMSGTGPLVEVVHKNYMELMTSAGGANLWLLFFL